MTDEERFEGFVRRFQDMVYATAVRLLGNPSDAEDVAQIVFLRAFERFPELGRNPSAPGWLKQVTRNLCLNHLSRYRSRWRLFSELGGDGAVMDFVDKIPDASLATSQTVDDRHVALERALQALPDDQRIPLVLFHFEDFSYREIADTLKISLGKVKTDIHRGAYGPEAVHGGRRCSRMTWSDPHSGGCHSFLRRRRPGPCYHR